MSWFFGRRKPQGIQPSSLDLEDGAHPSPGLELLWAYLGKNPPRAILDLGASSTENVRFLSKFTDNISIADLFRGTRAEPGTRASAFAFGAKDLGSLPETENTFDVVFLWDLLHYFDRQTFAAVEERLAAVCRPRAVVYLLAANHAKVPLTPIRFKLEGPESLHYTVPVGERTRQARLVTREVEIRLARFEPWRLFQLRNGLQEFLFRYEPPEVPKAAEPPSPLQTEAREPEPPASAGVTARSSESNRSPASEPSSESERFSELQRFSEPEPSSEPMRSQAPRESRDAKRRKKRFKGRNGR